MKEGGELWCGGCATGNWKKSLMSTLGTSSVGVAGEGNGAPFTKKQTTRCGGNASTQKLDTKRGCVPYARQKVGGGQET